MGTSVSIPVGRPQRDLPNLDLLRVFAVLFVFFGQLMEFYGVGRLGPFSHALVGWGVLIFFVHTCFVLMLSLERQFRDRGPANLFANFVVRRSFRILPLSMLAVALVVIFRLPLMSLEPHHFYAAPLSSSLVLLNLFLVQDITRSANILGPLWSLPLQIQVCLFLPALFLFIRPARSVWRPVILWVVAVGFGTMTLHSEGITSVIRAIPLFLPGAIAYQIQRKKISQQLPAFLWPVFIAALTILFLAGDGWGGVGGLLAREYCGCLLLGLLMPWFSQIPTRWLVVASRTVAKYSYGIYLTELFTFWLALEEMSHLPKIVRLGTLIILSAGLPVLLYHAIEEPMIHFGKQLVDRRPLTSIAPSKKPRFAAIRFGESNRAEMNTD